MLEIIAFEFRKGHYILDTSARFNLARCDETSADRQYGHGRTDQRLWSHLGTKIRSCLHHPLALGDGYRITEFLCGGNPEFDGFIDAFQSIHLAIAMRRASRFDVVANLCKSQFH